jgi:hypothetical protein
VSPLLFDEFLHKQYLAKITGSAISYYNIYDFNNERLYCGEGSFTFTCYYPYATGRYNFFEDIVELPSSWERGQIINLPDRPFSAKLITNEENLLQL